MDNPYAAPRAPVSVDAAQHKGPHPILFMLLIIPFGATSGFPTVALDFLATKSGLTVNQGAALVAVSLFPNVWKFFWAPIGDKTLTRKRWYLISCALCAAGMCAMAVVPLGASTFRLMEGIILVTSVAATFNGFAVEALVAHLTPPSERGRVSGWFQAGNLGGAGIGGGLGLWLLRSFSTPWVAGIGLAVLMMACALPLRWLHDVRADKTTGSVVASVRYLGKDIWTLIWSRDGFLCALLCFLPLGTGAAQSVLTQASVAAQWGAGEHEVELVQGLLTGAISMVGCLAGGFVCSRWLRARVAYAVFGGLMALVTALMAVSPMTVHMYIGYSLVYAFVTGLCYAAFSAFVFDVIGSGHAATKYNGFASLSNAPIWYMGLVLAWVDTGLGSKAMLFAESAFGVLGIVIFAGLVFALRPRQAAAAPAAAA